MGQTIHYSSIWTEPITVNLQNMTRFFWSKLCKF